MSDYVFPAATDMYERYKNLSTSDPYRKKRESYLKNYNRHPWIRKTSDNCPGKKDPNFGQFKAKVDSAIGVYINMLTERGSWVKVVPKYSAPALTKSFSDRITSSFHRLFIKPWENRFMDEVLASFDIVMYGKAIEHWPTPGCVYTENVPVERVFPDSAAGMNPEKWSYVFIEKDFYVAELEAMTKDGGENEYDFDITYLKEILKMPEANARAGDYDEINKHNLGDHSSGKDNQITIVFAYVKDNYKAQKKVSRYCFPAFVKQTDDNRKDTQVRFLSKEEEYCECLSNVIAVRSSYITRSYWKFNSFAEQIFLSTALYDKSMGLVIRAIRRSAVLYFKSDKPETQKKLLRQSDDEVQVVDPEVDLLTIQQNANIKDIVEMVRQIMIDTDNNMAIGQSPGSQNVKGYAITAQEATLRAQREGEQEGVSIKLLMHNDVRMYKEIYRRAIHLNAKEDAKARKAFIAEMQAYNIPEDAYNFDSIYFVPFFINGASQGARIQNAQGALNALAMNPSNPGQEQAQRDLVAAFVGHENIDAYIQEKTEVNPVIIKVGSENEDLDNPHVNPANIPVLPTDKHAQELPMHIADYEVKLKTAQSILQAGMQNPNKIRKVVLVQLAADLIQAQDNKGGHIQAHIQAMANSEDSMKANAQVIQKFTELQKMQDAMVAEMQRINQELDSSMTESSLDSEKERHLKTMNQLTEEHARKLNEIDLGKSIDKFQGMKEQREFMKDVKMEDASLKLATQETKAEIDVKKKQDEASTKQKDTQGNTPQTTDAGTAAAI